MSTPPNKAISALLAIDGLPPRPPSIVGLRLGVGDCLLELKWWPPAPPPELRLPSRLRVRWPTSLGLLLDPPMAKAYSAFKDREKKSVRQKIKKRNLIQIAFQGTAKDKSHNNFASNRLSCVILEYILWKNSSDCYKTRCRNQRRNGDHGSKPTETQCHVDRMNQNFPTDGGAAASPRFQHRHEIYFTPLPPAEHIHTADMSHMPACTCVRHRCTYRDMLHHFVVS